MACHERQFERCNLQFTRKEGCQPAQPTAKHSVSSACHRSKLSNKRFLFTAYHAISDCRALNNEWNGMVLFLIQSIALNHIRVTFRKACYPLKAERLSLMRMKQPTMKHACHKYMYSKL